MPTDLISPTPNPDAKLDEDVTREGLECHAAFGFSAPELDPDPNRRRRAGAGQPWR